MKNSAITQLYMTMIGKGINSPSLKGLRITDGATWITDEVFIWMHTKRDFIMVTIKPPDSYEDFYHYNIDITHDEIRIRKEYSVEATIFPRISTEEEYFQLSTIHEMTVFPLEFFQQCSVLFEKVWEEVSWCA